MNNLWANYGNSRLIENKIKTDKDSEKSLSVSFRVKA